MIRVDFTTFEFDPGVKEWIELPVARLVADRDELTISGPHADWINPDVLILDPESGEQVSRAGDTERWARLLPFAYRNGDLNVEVEEVAMAEAAGASFRYQTATG